MITEVTIYEKNDKMYCPACKPQGGKRGTFGTSEYDHFCAGCGEDLKEIGESQQLRKRNKMTKAQEKRQKDIEMAQRRLALKEAYLPQLEASTLDAQLKQRYLDGIAQEKALIAR